MSKTYWLTPISTYVSVLNKLLYPRGIPQAIHVTELGICVCNRNFFAVEEKICWLDFDVI